jgi:hypothetical protein
MQLPQTRRKPAPMHRSLARPFPYMTNRMTLMLAVAALAALVLSTMAAAAPLRLAQATAEGQQEAMPAVTGGGAESAAEAPTARLPASEGAAAGAGESEAPEGESAGMTGGSMMSGSQGKSGTGMMGQGMMRRGMLAMHGGGKGCARKHEGHKYYKYYKRLKKQLDRIEKRQILIETMLREQMLGGD